MVWNSHTTTGIPTIAYGNLTDLNIFENYGQLIPSEITFQATTYVKEDTRQTENNDQLYHSLKNLLNAAVTANIFADSTMYHIGSNTYGYLLFKLLLHKSIIDTSSACSKMRDNISSLDTQIATINFDIQKFNEYTKIKYFASYNQHKKYKYDNDKNKDKDNLKFWLSTSTDISAPKSSRQPSHLNKKNIVALYADLENMKDTNLKFVKGNQIQRYTKVKDQQAR